MRLAELGNFLLELEKTFEHGIEFVKLNGYIAINRKYPNLNVVTLKKENKLKAIELPSDVTLDYIKQNVLTEYNIFIDE